MLAKFFTYLSDGIVYALIIIGVAVTVVFITILFLLRTLALLTVCILKKTNVFKETTPFKEFVQTMVGDVFATFSRPKK